VRKFHATNIDRYVDNGALRHATFNKKDFNRIQEQEASIQVELGDDATYIVTGMGSISFCIPSRNVLELDNFYIFPV